MMQSKMSLESNRFFPYMAWALVFGFSFFVYTIAQDLRATTAELTLVAKRLEARANMNPQEIEDFNR